MKYYNSQGKLIGTLDKGVFTKKVKFSKHFFRVLSSWGFSKSVIDKLPDCLLKVIDTESDKVYTTKLSWFKEKAIARDIVEPQLFLPIRFWEIYSDGVKISNGRMNYNTYAINVKQEKLL